MKSGYILIDKDKGRTSFSVVSELRKILKTKKIGHTGTLDPMATGLLFFGIGKGTKAMSVLFSKRKEYIATLMLGITTDTDDITGKVLCNTNVKESILKNIKVKKSLTENMLIEKRIREVFSCFIGEQLQIPPMYSAKKINGKKLYNLAREGIIVDRKPSKITIYNIEILDINLPEIRFKVDCSKGTYIRTLCKDIGEKLGCKATMSSLRRIKTDDFNIEDAATLNELKKMSDKEIGDRIVPLDFVFKSYSKCKMKKEKDTYLKNGNTLYHEDFIEYEDGEIIRVYFSNDIFAALYKKDGNDYKALKMFL